MANTRTIIFDFDGTIVDSLDLVIEVFKEMVPEHENASQDQVEALRNLSVKDISSSLGVPIWKVPFLVNKGRGLMQKRIDQVSVFEGLEVALSQLQAKGCKLHIISSNSTENVQNYIKNAGLDQYFESINGGVGLFGKKKYINRLCKKYCQNKEIVWYVGDEIRDIKAAKKAGVHMVAVGWGFNHPETLKAQKPDAVAMNLVDLEKIILG